MYMYLVEQSRALPQFLRDAFLNLHLGTKARLKLSENSHCSFLGQIALLVSATAYEL